MLLLRRFRRILLSSIGVFVLICDQAVKIFLASFLKPAESIPVIKNIFHITLVFNTGCAFGLFKNQTTLIFLIASFLAIVFLVYSLKRLKGYYTFSKLAAILIIAGSLSNLTDRFRLGYVVDFLDFRIWPVFNLGDTAITVGASIFVLQLFLEPKTKV